MSDDTERQCGTCDHFRYRLPKSARESPTVIIGEEKTGGRCVWVPDNAAPFWFGEEPRLWDNSGQDCDAWTKRTTP
jgi:hypothetical protein